MAFKDWFSRRTALQLALERGIAPGGVLSDELRKLDGYRVRTAAEGEAICSVLDQLVTKPSRRDGDDTLNAIMGLMQDVERFELAAYEVIIKVGQPILIRLVDKVLRGRTKLSEDIALYALKLLAMYRWPEGTSTVIRAARKPLKPDAWMWAPILRQYAEEHSERKRLFRELAEPLPTDFLGVSLLDTANQACLTDSKCRHPYDSDSGLECLKSWLSDPLEEHFSYAHSATVALPFLKHPGRDALLAFAMDHPNSGVQMEAAWAAAKLKREAGVRWLARCCLDVNTSSQARRYLSELGREDAIPAEASSPEFEARAEFAEWLAHPNELARAPDAVDVVDHRMLDWPPERVRKPFWLVRYTAKDKTGLKPDDQELGLVGSMTFCFFGYKLIQRPSEDAYAIHCSWEMEHQNLIEYQDVEDGSKEYDRLLRDSKIDGVKSPQIVKVAELSAALQYPKQLIAVASAEHHGQSGWLVLDGSRSAWYAESELPPDETSGMVLKIHIGRVLLGFGDEPNRKQYLKPPVARSASETAAAWKRLLDDARAQPALAAKLLGDYSVLGSSFSDCVDAHCELNSWSRSACIVALFEELLQVAETLDREQQAKALDSFSQVGRNFETYADAMIELRRSAELSVLIQRLMPLWDHNWGDGILCQVAYRNGDMKLAEKLLLKIRNNDKNWQRSEEMDLLAELWHKQGRQQDARDLLLDAQIGLLKEHREATGSDRKLFADWIRDRQTTFLRLFPEDGPAILKARKIPQAHN